MLPYKLYFVATAKVRPGKAEAAKNRSNRGP